MFKVEYWSPFYAKWVEYVAPSWGAKAIRHHDKRDAAARVERLKRDHPNDKFRVTE